MDLLACDVSGWRDANLGENVKEVEEGQVGGRKQEPGTRNQDVGRKTRDC